MDKYVCPICHESCYLRPDRRLFVSDACRHRLCGACLAMHFSSKLPSTAFAFSAAAAAAASSAADARGGRRAPGGGRAGGSAAEDDGRDSSSNSSSSNSNSSNTTPQGAGGGAGAEAAAAGAAAVVAQQQQRAAKGFCPLCRVAVTLANYKEADVEAEVFDIEKEIRRRVEGIFNSTRERFPDTPAYEDYREKKEEMIYQLVHGNDDMSKRKVEAELRQQEKQNSRIILENKELLKRREREKVLQIVQREGTFYELVKCRPAAAALGASAAYKEKLVHPLERQYASYFKSDSTAAAAVTSALQRGGAPGACKPLDASIKEDTDIPRPRYRSRNQFEMAGITAGFTPQLLLTRGMVELLGSVLFSPADSAAAAPAAPAPGGPAAAAAGGSHTVVKQEQQQQQPHHQSTASV